MTTLAAKPSFEERWGSRSPIGAAARYTVMIALLAFFPGFAAAPPSLRKAHHSIATV